MRGRGAWMLLLAALACGSASADAVLPAIGGSGGGQFKARCPAAQVLTGVELRVGDDVDAIRPLCVTVVGPRSVGPAPYTVGSGLVQGAGSGAPFGPSMILAPGWFGGPGGALTNLVCPADHPVVTGLYIGAEGVDTVIVNNIHLFCGEVSATPGTSDYPAAVMDAPGYRPSKSPIGFGVGGASARNSQDTERCPTGTVAVGIHGRSGKWLDAVGLACDIPPAPPPPGVRTIGRANPSSPASGQAVPICDAARAARSRHSPAAAALEARCAEQGAAVQRIGRVGRAQAGLPGQPAPAPSTQAPVAPPDAPTADAPPVEPAADAPLPADPVPDEQDGQ